MIRKLFYLEWKSFFRSGSFATSLALKIVMIFLGVFMVFYALLLGFGGYFILEDLELEPFSTVNKFLIYYLLTDTIIRFVLQKIPTLNIRLLLTLPIPKSKIIHYSLIKTVFSVFNFIPFFLFVPFAFVCKFEGNLGNEVFIWLIAVYSWILFNNFLNILINNKDNIANIYGIIIVALGVSQYMNWFDITDYTQSVFSGFYDYPVTALIPVLALAAIYYFTFRFFKQNFYLDAVLNKKETVAATEDFSWLDRFGKTGTFLKLDIRMMKRNKRSKTTIGMSVLFLFYGLLFFTNSLEVYNAPVWKIFAGIFVSGGFLFTFGQFVPSWDSSYYPLLMTQNIPYKEYIKSKWWLIVIATALSTVLCLFYLFIGWDVYLMILAGAIYNIGVNSYLVLLGGAFTKTPIDLSSSKGAFGDKKAFNMQAMLISLPKILLPMVFYAIGYYTVNYQFGVLLVAIAGVLGFAFRNAVFNRIEKIYKREKYSTLHSYKQKNA